MSTTIGHVYEDRNALAVAFAMAVHHLSNAIDNNGYNTNPSNYRACWTEPTDEDDADADQWAVVYVWLPTGQVSWHVPRELVEEAKLPKESAEWDGHGRGEKNDRLRKYTR